MACCYIAASMIAFIIRSCDALDINLNLQYNDVVKHEKDAEDPAFEGKQVEVERSGTTILSISGMTCAACTVTVENALHGIEGVEKPTVSLALQEARVFHDPNLNRQQLLEAIGNVGYDATVGERSSQQKIATLKHTEELEVLRSSLRGLVMSSTLVFSLGSGVDLMGANIIHHPILAFIRSSILFALTTFGVWSYGWWIFEKAWNGAVKGQLNMHSLISVSTITGLLMTAWNISRSLPGGHFDSIIGVLLIITVGRYMDLLSRRRATDTFTGLYSLLDETSSAKLISLNKRVPTSALRPGDEIIVDPFSVIPCDGYIVEGSSKVNEAILTGESLPKPKSVGDLLLAGSRNGSGELRVFIQQNDQESFLSQLINSIEGSLTSKASTQLRVDTITQNFVAVVFVVAIFAAMTSFKIEGSDDMNRGLSAAGERLMAVLAAACPCALGLATPCAVMAGIDVAWRNGILILEGGETMESVQGISHVVLDKTGTLTRGVPQVTDMAINAEWKSQTQDLAVLICAAEQKCLSVHPLASAIFKKLLPMCGAKWAEYQDCGQVSEWKEVAGRGMECKVDTGQDLWRTICVGNMDFMKESGVGGLGSAAESVAEHGSIVFVGVDGDLAASLILQDSVRQDAKATVDGLKTRSIEVSVLTGDHSAEACRVSQELGIPVMASSATPEVKLQHVRDLQRDGHKVMMVGDGINDGPSLAAAEIGVMMAHGRRCFTSGGNVLIFQSQLNALSTLLDISQSTMKQVSVNVWWALVYNVVAIALAVGLGRPFHLEVTPPIAAAMMSFSSIFITLQGLLLRASLSRQHKTADD